MRAVSSGDAATNNGRGSWLTEQFIVFVWGLLPYLVLPFTNDAFTLLWALFGDCWSLESSLCALSFGCTFLTIIYWCPYSNNDGFSAPFPSPISGNLIPYFPFCSWSIKAIECLRLFNTSSFVLIYLLYSWICLLSNSFLYVFASSSSWTRLLSNSLTNLISAFDFTFLTSSLNVFAFSNILSKT